MRTFYVIVAAVMALSVPSITSAQDVDGAAAAIREAVSGKICVGKDTLKFGKAAAGSPGTFERVGQPKGMYAVGYGTLLIRRGQELHGHVTAVSVSDHTLYVSADAYQCGPDPKEAPTPAKLPN